MQRFYMFGIHAITTTYTILYPDMLVNHIRYSLSTVINTIVTADKQHPERIVPVITTPNVVVQSFGPEFHILSR